MRCEETYVTPVVDEIPWLVSHLDNFRCLTVYRSLAMRESDEKFRPVWAALAEADYMTVIRREVVDDPEMMFGKAELTLYQLNERRRSVRSP